MIFAVGETLDLDFCRASGLKLKESGTIEVDRFSLETSRARFYAGGDVITGASNVSNAMGFGKQAARNIDLQLMEAIAGQVVSGHGSTREAAGTAEPPRRHISRTWLRARACAREEVVTGLTHEEALEEACVASAVM